MKSRCPPARAGSRISNWRGSVSYLPSFQISAASFQSLPIFSHTTRYFAGGFLRCRTLSLEAEGPDLVRRGGPEWLDLEGRQFRIADLRGHAFPQCLDRGSALHHAGTRRECHRVFGVERRDAGEITLVEEIYPFNVHRLNLGLLGERRRDERGHQGNHRCNAAHDSWLLT